MNAKLEMRIYEALGVKLFRKMVFLMEKLIHRKDRGLNINYHIPNRDASALDAFIKYLFYNGTIHARNLLIFALYLLLKVIFQWHFRLYDIVLCILALKDLYCVILQRYNMLRIKQCQELLAERQARKKEKAVEKLKNEFATSYDFSFAAADLALVQRLKSSIENRESIVLSEHDVVALNRLLLINNHSVEDAQ